jgi:hypothetical protein
MDRIADLEAENSRLTSEVNNWKDTAGDAEGSINQLRAILYLVPRINKCPLCWSHILASGILTKDTVRIRGEEE